MIAPVTYAHFIRSDQGFKLHYISNVYLLVGFYFTIMVPVALLAVRKAAVL